MKKTLDTAAPAAAGAFPVHSGAAAPQSHATPRQRRHVAGPTRPLRVRHRQEMCSFRGGAAPSASGPVVAAAAPERSTSRVASCAISVPLCVAAVA
jgi:hypothetical protein